MNCGFRIENVWRIFYQNLSRFFTKSRALRAFFRNIISSLVPLVNKLKYFKTLSLGRCSLVLRLSTNSFRITGKAGSNSVGVLIAVFVELFPPGPLHVGLPHPVAAFVSKVCGQGHEHHVPLLAEVRHLCRYMAG